MAKFEFVKKFIKANNTFGEAITKSGEQYVKTMDPDADQDDPTAEEVEDETTAIEKGIDGVAPQVLKYLRLYERFDKEIEKTAKDNASIKTVNGIPERSAEEIDTGDFKIANKEAKRWLITLARTINEFVLQSDIAKADSAGRFTRAGREFLESSDEIQTELAKHSASVLKTAVKDTAPPDLPPSDFVGDFKKVLKAGKIDADTAAFARDIKEVETRFNRLDKNRVYAKFQDLCKPAMAALEDLIKELEKFDPKKSKGDKDDDVDPKQTKAAAKLLSAFAKKVDEYDDRIFLFSRL